MSTYKITIPYTPKAKGSWRLGKYGQYNPSAKGMNKTKAYVLKHLANQKLPLMSGPLLVIVHYRIPAPVSQPTRRRAPQHLLPHIKKPDGDNLEKFLNDSLNGIVWSDDSCIAWLVRSKTTTVAKEGETIIFVRQLENLPSDYELIISDIKENIEIGNANAN